MADEQEAQYTPPASQVDLEQRLKVGNASSRVLSTSDVKPPPVEDDEGRTFAVEGNDTDDYFGTSAEYRTYANETDAPHRSEEGPESELEEQLVTRPDMARDPKDDPNVSDEEDDEGSDGEPSPEPQAMSAKSGESGTRSATTAKKTTASK